MIDKLTALMNFKSEVYFFYLNSGSSVRYSRGSQSPVRGSVPVRRTFGVWNIETKKTITPTVVLERTNNPIIPKSS